MRAPSVLMLRPALFVILPLSTHLDAPSMVFQALSEPTRTFMGRFNYTHKSVPTCQKSSRRAQKPRSAYLALGYVKAYEALLGSFLPCGYTSVGATEASYFTSGLVEALLFSWLSF